MTDVNRLRNGSLLMAAAGVAFIGYGILFLLLNFFASGFELGVSTLNGVTRSDIEAFEPGVLNYISHLHVATAAFIISTGLAVAALAWRGVRDGQLWAWHASVAAAVIGLLIALPMHWGGLFDHNWLVHLGPVYLAAVVFVVGAGLAWPELRGTTGVPGAAEVRAGSSSA